MQLQNKNRIAYLGALTLLFSYAEMLLPRIVPFFRLGLGNVIILLALNLNLPSFMILTVIKAVASSIMNGTLISPFFLISVSQSVVSGLVMYGFFRIKGKWLSIYGISLIGSAVSGIVQLLLSSLYLGSSTMNLLGPMLLFSIIAGIITAFLSQIIKLPEKTPVLKTEIEGQNQSQNQSNSKKSIFLVALIILAIAACFMLKNLWILAAALVIAFALQKICGRKIMILPHISMWIFVLIVSLFTPSGKVLFKIFNWSITEGSLLEGIEKALKLSITAALSQCATAIKPSSKTLLGTTLAYYQGLHSKFKSSQGKIFKRIQQTFTADEL